MTKSHDPGPQVVTQQHPGYRRGRATWVGFAAAFAFGILNASLGPTLPYLRETQHTSYLAGALHQVAYAVGSLVAGLQASRYHAPRRRVIIVGLLGAATAGLLLGYGRILPLTLLAAFLVSAFGTAAIIRTWAVLSDLHRRHRAVALSEGEVAVSFAGIFTPAIIGACAAAAVGWQFSFVIGFALVLAAVVAVGCTPLPPTAAGRAKPSSAGTPAAGPNHATRGAYRTLVTIFAVVGLELTLTFWGASYLNETVGIDQDVAVTLMSTLYAANVIGRLLASRFARRLPATTVLWLALGAALAGTPILLTAQGPIQAAIGLVVTGTGIGGTFPIASALHVAASHRPADQAVGEILTVVGIGQIVAPFLAGAIAQATDLRYGLLVLPALIVMAVTTHPHRSWTRPPRPPRHCAASEPTHHRRPTMTNTPPTTLPCSAILFDCDGVLVDSDASVLKTWTRWAHQMGLDPEAVVAVVHGRRSADTVAALIEPSRQAAALELIDSFEVDEADTATAIPGAAELLASLPPERWATVTSGARNLASARLAAVGLMVPEVLITAEDVTEGKPHPEGYRTAAQRLGVPARECVVLEDAPAGIHAARAAGVGHVIGVGNRPQVHELADITVPDLHALRWTGAGLQILSPTAESPVA